MREQAKVTSKGQITIPLNVRRRLALEPGDHVVFEIAGTGVVVRRAPPDASEFEKYRGCLVDLVGEDPDLVVEEMRGR